MISTTRLFKLNWVIMSIVLLCLMALGLYALIQLLEKRCIKRETR